jgi:hypothetical protein
MKNKRTYAVWVSLILALLFLVAPLHAKEAGGNTGGDLAKATQNAVADPISLPFQWNTFLNTGPDWQLQFQVQFLFPKASSRRRCGRTHIMRILWGRWIQGRICPVRGAGGLGQTPAGVSDRF